MDAESELHFWPAARLVIDAHEALLSPLNGSLSPMWVHGQRERIERQLDSGAALGEGYLSYNQCLSELNDDDLVSLFGTLYTM